MVRMDEDEERLRRALETFKPLLGTTPPSQYGLAPAADPAVDEYFDTVAATGCALFDWPLIRAPFLWKLDAVLTQMDVAARPPPADADAKPPPPSPYVDKIARAAAALRGIPFTFQRLCELMMEPKRHYRLADKLFRAVLKNLNVVTVVLPSGERDTGSVIRPNPHVAPATEQLDNGLDERKEDAAVAGGDSTPTRDERSDDECASPERIVSVELVESAADVAMESGDDDQVASTVDAPAEQLTSAADTTEPSTDTAAAAAEQSTDSADDRAVVTDECAEEVAKCEVVSAPVEVLAADTTAAGDDVADNEAVAAVDVVVVPAEEQIAAEATDETPPIPKPTCDDVAASVAAPVDVAASVGAAPLKRLSDGAADESEPTAKRVKLNDTEGDASAVIDASAD